MHREREPLLHHKPDLLAVTFNVWDQNRLQRAQAEQIIRHFEHTHLPTLVAFQEVNIQTLRYLQEREGLNGLAWVPDFYNHHTKQWYYLTLFGIGSSLIPEGDLHSIPLPFPASGNYSQLEAGINESMYALWQDFRLGDQLFSVVNMHAAMSLSHEERKQQFILVHQYLGKYGASALRLILADFNTLGNPIANHYYAFLEKIKAPPWSVRDSNWNHEYPVMQSFWESMGYQACYDQMESTAFPRHWWHAWWATFCEYFGYTNPLDNILISRPPEQREALAVLGTRLGPFAFSDHRAVITALRVTGPGDGIIGDE